jgi:hypothetical protein
MCVCKFCEFYYMLACKHMLPHIHMSTSTTSSTLADDDDLAMISEKMQEEGRSNERNKVVIH